MQGEYSFRAIVVHLQQYHCVTVTALSIINEEHFLIMAIYFHSCVHFLQGRYGGLALKQRRNVNRCFREEEGKKKQQKKNNNYANLPRNNYGRIHYL